MDKLKYFFYGFCAALLVSGFLISTYRPKVITKYVKIRGQAQGETKKVYVYIPDKNSSSTVANLTLQANVPVLVDFKAHDFEIKGTGITEIEYKDSLLKVNIYLTECQLIQKVKPDLHWDIYAGLKNLSPIIGVDYSHSIVLKNICVSLGGEFETQSKSFDLRTMIHYKF